MRALVTGVAGFIGSHLGERLSSEGWNVRGVDVLSDYYDRRLKEGNLAMAQASGPVDFRHEDLRTCDIAELLDGVDVVFHFAAQPGVRASWDDFDSHVSNNLAATQRLLDSARSAQLSRFVFASSSSVYGQITSMVDEDSPTRPYSPYGVSKLAAEALCGAYAQNFDVPTVNLRLFTVYGPRQRPDMAFQRIIAAAQTGTPFSVYGDGSQVRSFTYVGDVVDAAVKAAESPAAVGRTINISGGSTVTLSHAITTVSELVGSPVPVEFGEKQPGDVQRTGADPALAAEVLAWHPATSLVDGLRQQVESARATPPS